MLLFFRFHREATSPAELRLRKLDPCTPISLLLEEFLASVPRERPFSAAAPRLGREAPPFRPSPFQTRLRISENGKVRLIRLERSLKMEICC